MTPKDKAHALRNAIPSTGLFAGKSWRLSPSPLLLSPTLMEKLEELGPRLFKFQQACNLLYRQSVEGKQPGWIANYLDAGKPEPLIQAARDRRSKSELPIVIRPDILLNGDDFSITELDSVPGGIGVTAWLQETFLKLPPAGNTPRPATDSIEVARPKMITGFLGGLQTAIQNQELPFPAPHPFHLAVVVSDEAADYRPEMEWLITNCSKLQGTGFKFFVCKPEELTYDDTGVFLKGIKLDLIYRFFELFDLPNIADSTRLLYLDMHEKIKVTPPFKPQLEEKLWLALFWFPQLAEFWRRELGDRYFRDLKNHIPFTWILDPSPLPPHAVIPKLEIQNWENLKTFSQKQRNLILKISGFSPLAWGSRGVHLGSDMSSEEWIETVQTALDSFPTNPYILQTFSPTSLSTHEWYNFETEQLETMQGRVRLCPYYFIDGRVAKLSGILATICPADKKLIHGMEESILNLAL